MPTSGQYDLNAFRQNKNNYYAAYLQDDFRYSRTLHSTWVCVEGETPSTERFNPPSTGLTPQPPARLPPGLSLRTLRTRSPESRSPVQSDGGALFYGARKYRHLFHPQGEFLPRIGLRDAGRHLQDGDSRRRGHLFIFHTASPATMRRLQPDHPAGRHQRWLSHRCRIARNPFPNGIQRPSVRVWGWQPSWARASPITIPTPAMPIPPLAGVGTARTVPERASGDRIHRNKAVKMR